MRARSLLVLTTAAALAIAPGAGAKTLGRLTPKDTPSGGTCSGCHGFQKSTAPSSPSYAVPAGKWKITSWRTRNTTDHGVAARLWIFRPTGPDVYKLIGRSEKVPVGAGKAPSHKTSIKVKKGDLIGLESFGDMITTGPSAAAEDVAAGPTCRHVANGQSVGTGTGCGNYEANGLINVTATLKRR
jgi:hypothetical protein